MTDRPIAPLPALFLSHGAPTLALEDVPTTRFFAELGASLPRPRAILVVSAHWETADLRVLATPRPDTVHDFYGFPAPLYELRYPASGAVALAATVADTLRSGGFHARCDDQRGLDHGVWVPLLRMFPRADIPVTQVSIAPDRPPLFHWRLGRALAELRGQGVLIVGSGAITHNLGDFRLQRHDQAAPVAAYAAEFADWIASALAEQALDRLLGYREIAPHAARAHPTDEHLLPLFVALGAAGVAWTARRIHHGFMHGAFAMDAYRFDSAAGMPDPVAVPSTSVH